MCLPIFNQSDTNNFHPTDFRGFKTTPHLITRLQEKAAICISLYLTNILRISHQVLSGRYTFYNKYKPPI